MKKILCAVFMCLSVTAFAQKNSIGLDFGLPIGYLSRYAPVIVGGSYRYTGQVSSNPKLAFVGTFGFQKAFLRTKFNSNLMWLTFRGGPQYRVGQSVFLLMEMGLSVDIGDQYNNNQFLFAPGIGFDLAKGIDLSCQFMVVEFSSSFNARLGFKF
jgi:hypothetical protein